MYKNKNGHTKNGHTKNEHEDNIGVNISKIDFHRYPAKAILGLTVMTLTVCVIYMAVFECQNQVLFQYDCFFDG
jgi:hypothetical protein